MAERKVANVKETEEKTDWHYEFADKVVQSWPTWKQEIYTANYIVEKSNC